MPESRSRKVISIRRQVPPSRREDYDAGWARVRAEADLHDVHAWRFVATSQDDLFIEFLEFAGDNAVGIAAVTRAIRDLDTRLDSPPTTVVEEWTALPDPDTSSP